MLVIIKLNVEWFDENIHYIVIRYDYIHTIISITFQNHLLYIYIYIYIYIYTEGGFEK